MAGAKAKDLPPGYEVVYVVVSTHGSVLMQQIVKLVIDLKASIESIAWCEKPFAGVGLVAGEVAEFV